MCVCGQGVARSLVLHRLSCGEESQPGGWTERPGRAQSSAVTSIDTTRLDEPTSGRRAEREKQSGSSPNAEKSVRVQEAGQVDPGAPPKSRENTVLRGREWL